jgi:hypothetical protein
MMKALPQYAQPRAVLVVGTEKRIVVEQRN